MKTSHAVLAVGLCIAGLAGYGFLRADAKNPAKVAAVPSGLQAKLLAMQEELSRLRGQVAANQDTAQQALASALQRARLSRARPRSRGASPSRLQRRISCGKMS